MQSSFYDLEYAAKKKLTRRDRFLAEIDAVTPWAALAAVLDLFTPRVRAAVCHRSVLNSCCVCISGVMQQLVPRS